MVDVTALRPDEDADEWNHYVDRSPSTTPFYRAEALELQAEYTGTTLHPLVGFVGREPVGIFPVFEYRKGPVPTAFSPAPYSWVSYLGPALLDGQVPSQRKADRRNRRFLGGCLDRIDRTISPVYSRIVVAGYEDVRPFTWRGHDATPEYTYVVPLDGKEEALLDRFSGDARRNVRNAEGYVVEEGNADDARAIVEHVRRRYENQGQRFHMEPAFAADLYDALPEGALRPYVCRVDGEFLGGILVVESADTRYRWQGGVKPDAEIDLPINDLLDWHVMRDGLRSGIDRYDLVGAGVPSINRYKAKFDPELVPYYTITNGAFGVEAVIDGYRSRS